MEYLYLTEKEFVVLLSVVGCREWIGILDKNVFQEWDMESEINEILVSLYQKCVIEWENGKATILPPVRRIFELLKNVQQYVFYARLDEDYPEEYLYVLDGDVVRIRRSVHEAGKLRIAFQPLEDVEAELWENKIFPVNTELFEVDLPMDYPEIDANAEKLIQSKVVLAFEKRSFSKKEALSRFLVQEKGIYNFFVVQKERKTQVYYEEKESIQKLFDKWIGEVEA